jgi:hypothetical protein
MAVVSPSQVNQLLQTWSRGDCLALRKAIRLVIDALPLL